MARVKTTFKLDFTKMLNKLVDKRTASTLGNGIVRKMKEHMNKGLSPVRKFGRFVKYKESYRKQIKGGLSRGKTISPVNLKLSGDMQDALDWERKSDGTVKVGIFNTRRDIVQRAETHNDGTHPHVPQRKFIPDKEGEEFSVTIQRFIKTVYESRLRDIIKRSNRP